MKKLIFNILKQIDLALALLIYPFFFNKWLFLILRWGDLCCIFVMQSAMRHKQTKLMNIQSVKKTMVKWCTTLKVAVLAGVLIGLTTGVFGQGWQLNYGAPKTDEGWAVLQMEDLGFMVVGFGESFGADNDQDIFVVRTDVDGTVIWSRYYDEGFQEQARAIVPTADGNFLIVGNIKTRANEKENIYFLKIDRKGGLLWSRQFGSATLTERASGAVADADGGFTVIGTTETVDRAEDIIVAKFDANANPVWFKTFGTDKQDRGNALIRFGNGYAFVGDSKNPLGFDNDIILYRLTGTGETIWQSRIANSFREEGKALVATRDGGLAIAGVINDNTDAFVAKYDANGRQIWARAIGEPAKEEEANDITELADGSLVITGLQVVDPVNVDVFVAKLDSKGNVRWDKNLGDPLFTEEGRSIKATAEGGFIIAGYNGKLLSSFNDLILLKTDANGNTISNYVNGRVFADRNNSCDYNNGETPLQGWLVQASGPLQTYFATTKADGSFSVQVDTGRYDITVIPPNGYWESCNRPAIRLTEFYDSVRVDLPVQAKISCPFLEVDVKTPFLALCNDITYNITYANTGTAAVENAYIDFNIDANLVFKNSSVPFLQLPNNSWRVQIGRIDAGARGGLDFQVALPCQGIAQGQAAMVTAQIFPDTSCFQVDPDWDGSSLKVTGRCDLDLVRFVITNVGKGAMKKAARSIVVRDDVMLRQRELEFKLSPQESIDLDLPANGSTYRLIAEQASGHPSGDFATAFVEGCVTDGKPIITGQVTQFPENDQDPNTAIDIQEIKSAVLPVELRGHPKGYRNEAIIDTKTDLTYTVLFKNISTDPVQRVVIRDTLPEALDVTSIQPGASNFPYRFEVFRNGVVKITFDSIRLPSAGSSALQPYGYVQFRVAQKDGNPKGTVIKNKITAFFDYQKPVASNAVQHVTDTYPDFIRVITSAQEVHAKGVKVNIYPNPFSEQVTFEVLGRQYPKMQMSIFNTNGQRISEMVFESNVFVIHRNQLPAGLYLYRLESEGQLINSGKLLVR